MTNKIFLRDSYIKELTTTIKKLIKVSDNKYHIILEDSIFHPQSGGQIKDGGTIKGKNGEGTVIDIIEEDNELVHIVKMHQGAFHEGDKINCILDWNVRYSIMRAHTGEHILARSFMTKVPGADIIKVHIDNLQGDLVIISPSEISWDTITEVEILANRKIYEKIPVEIKDFKNLADAEKYYGSKLREHVPDPNQPLRIIEIGDFDFSACVGTHVKNTGEVGLVKVVGIEGSPKEYRISFVVAEKAIDKGIKIANTALKLARKYTSAVDELPKKIVNLENWAKELKKDLVIISKRLVDYEINYFIKNNSFKVGSADGFYGIMENIDQKFVIPKLINLGKKGKLGIVGIKNKNAAIIVVLPTNFDLNINVSQMIANTGKIICGGGRKRENLILIGGKCPEKVNIAMDRILKMFKPS